MRNVFQKKISINSALLLSLIPLLFLSMLFMLVVMRGSSQNALNNVAQETMARNLELTDRYVASMVIPAQEVGRYISRQVNNKDIRLDDWDIANMLLEKLKYSSHLYSLYVGRSDGSFILAGWRPHYMQEAADLWLYLRRISIENGERKVIDVWIDPEDLTRRTTLERPNDQYDPRTRPWFQKVQAEGQASWTKPYIFYMTQKAGITYAAPIQNTGSTTQCECIVGVDLRLNTLAKFLDKNRFSKNSSSFIFTEQKEILAHPNLIDQLQINELPTLESMQDPVLLEGYAAYRQSPEYANGQKFFSAISTATGNRDIIFKMTESSPGTRLIIGEQVPESDYLASLKHANHQAMLTGGGILVVVLCLGLLLARSMSRPIRNLSRMANKVKELDFGTKLESDSHFIEIHQTITSFNDMLQSLEENREQNNQLTGQLKQAHLDTLYRLALAAEFKDKDTAGHLDRVSGYSIIIAEALGLDQEEIEVIRHASVMHDVGKLSIPDSILLKKGTLDADEWEIMRSHTIMGGKILENASSRIMETARIIALSHHEKWNGKGYPQQLSGEDIPHYGRIIAVADVFDALLSKRSYKSTSTVPKAMQTIEALSGIEFDPECVTAFKSRLSDIVAVHQRYQSPSQTSEIRPILH